MEIRLSEKLKMRTVLNAVRFRDEPIFERIFDELLCQKIVQYYFENYILSSLLVFDLNSNPQSILKRIIKDNPQISTAKAIYKTGLEILCKDNGIKSLRKIIEPKTSLRSWQRVSAEIRLLNKSASLVNSHSFIKDISTSINRFEPYKLN